jgi:neopullulanase
MFDAVMNYFVGKAAVSFFANKTFNIEFKHPDYTLQTIDAKGFAEQIDTFLNFYDWQINLAQLNMLDSHDTPRALWLMGEDKSAMRLAVLFQMTMPGAPNVYYGSEIGMTGGPDPDCRRAFLWDQPETWDHDLREYYKRAIALRHAHPVLRTGGYADLYAKGEVVVYGRRLDSSEALVAFNVGDKAHAVTTPLDGLDATSYSQVWPAASSHTFTPENGKLHLTIPPRSGVVLVSNV